MGKSKVSIVKTKPKPDYAAIRKAVEKALELIGGVDDLIMMWKLRRKSLPARTGRQARAQLREPSARDGKADLKWPGGRAGS